VSTVTAYTTWTTPSRLRQNELSSVPSACSTSTRDAVLEEQLFFLPTPLSSQTQPDAKRLGKDVCEPSVQKAPTRSRVGAFCY
jgi:hypothetical protein